MSDALAMRLIQALPAVSHVYFRRARAVLLNIRSVRGFDSTDSGSSALDRK